LTLLLLRRILSILLSLELLLLGRILWMMLLLVHVVLAARRSAWSIVRRGIYLALSMDSIVATWDGYLGILSLLDRRTRDLSSCWVCLGLWSQAQSSHRSANRMVPLLLLLAGRRGAWIARLLNGSARSLLLLLLAVLLLVLTRAGARLTKEAICGR
jgi:putative Ca2+/H+ antiporter (TMEM165/GDT1 family)